MDTTSLILIGIGGLVVLLIVTAFLFLLFCGLLHNIQVSTGKPPIGQFTVVYKFERGPYSNCSYTFAEATSINGKLKCFGVYYDDPETVPASDLRWAVGCVVAEDNAKPDPAVVEMFTSRDYKVFSFPAIPTAVVTSFPYVTPVSIWLAVKRVYPQLGDYVKRKQLNADPWLEIYQNDLISFMLVLSKHKEFYVPEAETPKAVSKQ